MSDIPYLEMGDGETIAVRASSRGRAKAEVSGITGQEFSDVRVVRRFMRQCSCEACREGSASRAHGFDEFWLYCASPADGAVEWWVESHGAQPRAVADAVGSA
ncbi:MAG TPA: hypothetical protein VG265_05810 [Gaiellaceae bacterium]|nr:hypothetical protein [Gaiellaceae bacterium]